MKKVAIVGLGLMGGSLGAAIIKYRKDIEVLGISRNNDTIEEAIKRNIIHKGSTKIEDVVNEVDIIFVATPVRTIPAYIKKICNIAKKDIIITDLGSVKEAIWNEIKDSIPSNVHYVGGHPLTGKEKRGIRFSTSELYMKSTYVLVPYRSDKNHLKKIESILKSIGCKVIIMDAPTHDVLLGFLSHLPHLIAYALVLSLEELPHREEMHQLIPPSFKDLTRIASSEPDLWTDIFTSNRSNLHNSIKLFSSYLQKLDSLIENSPEELKVILQKAKSIKENFKKST